MKRFTVKNMNVNDLDEVLSIAASSSLNHWSKNMFIGEIRNPFSHCFTIRIQEISNHPVVGFICFRNIEDESELLNICVHPEYRLSGVAKTLMQFYIGFCSKKKIKAFYLDVDASNRLALNLYQSFSYQLLGIRKNFYQWKFDALLMVKKI